MSNANERPSTPALQVDSVSRDRRVVDPVEQLQTVFTGRMAKVLPEPIDLLTDSGLIPPDQHPLCNPHLYLEVRPVHDPINRQHMAVHGRELIGEILSQVPLGAHVIGISNGFCSSPLPTFTNNPDTVYNGSPFATYVAITLPKERPLTEVEVTALQAFGQRLQLACSDPQAPTR
jgi:hypothetical protein